jgi:peptidyl-tRNA hydrolase
MNGPVLYVLLNGELNMSPGKAAAQTAHVVASLHSQHGINDFMDEYQRTVIVLEAENQQQLKNLETYLYQMEIRVATYIDEGVNEVSPYSVTALAAGPLAADDLEMREIFKPFPLYGKQKKKWWQ